ncbi:AAA family ATPase [Escherichia coli]|nr:dephospho-CoA kinase [Escherichia coli]
MDYRIGITGAQGSGKTTLAKYIDKHYGIPYVDAGVGSLMSRLGVRVGDSMPLVTNGAIVIHTQRLKSDPGGNLLS